MINPLKKNQNNLKNKVEFLLSFSTFIENWNKYNGFCAK